MRHPCVALAECCELLDHIRKPVKESERVNGPYPYFGANGQQGWINGHLFDEPLVLLAEDGGHFSNPERGIAYKINGKTWVNNHAHALRPIKGIVDVDYLAHALKNKDVRRHLSGSTRDKLTKAGACQIEIPLPPLEEQRRIAAILDKASSIVATQQRRTAILWQLEASLFSQMAAESASDLKNCMLKELTADGDKINYGVVQPGNQFDGGVPLIRVGDLVSGGVDRSAIKCIDPAIEATYTRSRIVGNEILLSRVGSIGVVALVEPRDVGSNIARAVARVPVSQSANRKWLAACLRSTNVQRYFINELRTVSQPTLNIKQIEETIIRLPPIELQNSFAIKLDAIEKLCKRSSFSEAQVSNLISAFQSKAFIGRP